MGFGINHPKSELDSPQDVEFLGFAVNSNTMELKLPGEKINMIRADELNFTVQQLQHGSQKVTLEFVKRMDPDLLFYYHTSMHTRYSEGQLSDFNKATNTPKHEGRRVPSRDVSATMFTPRATLPVRGTLSVHTQFQLISPLPRGDIPTRK